MKYLEQEDLEPRFIHDEGIECAVSIGSEVDESAIVVNIVDYKAGDLEPWVADNGITWPVAVKLIEFKEAFENGDFPDWGDYSFEDWLEGAQSWS